MPHLFPTACPLPYKLHRELRGKLRSVEIVTRVRTIDNCIYHLIQRNNNLTILMYLAGGACDFSVDNTGLAVARQALKPDSM